MDKKYYYNPSGQAVGYLENGIYHFERRVGHFFVKGKGYPISDSILQELKRDGCTTVMLIEKRKNNNTKVYITDLDSYLNSPLFQEAQFDTQRCYPVKDMREV